MSERERLEEAIKGVLATETQAIPLSNKLFWPDGLFSRLGRTEEERRVVAQSPLFREALRRLSELQRKEAAEFARVVQQAQTAMSVQGYRLKLESADRAS